MTCAVSPYISGELLDWSFEADGIRVLAPERTYWEKLLILHSLYYGYEGKGRLPTDRDLISRHFYDVAMITETETGRSALPEHRSARCGPGTQPHRFSSGLEAVRESRPRFGAIDSTTGVTLGD